jgi:hypothetical protein
MPSEFWGLTPREFMLKLDGFFRSEERRWNHIGTLGTWILAPWLKKNQQLGVHKLLGRPLRLWPRTTTDED